MKKGGFLLWPAALMVSLAGAQLQQEVSVVNISVPVRVFDGDRFVDNLIRDGAVLKIEWAPASMGNYQKIEDFAKAIGAKPKIMFSSECTFEKNGLRFPSLYSVVESYSGIPGRTRLTLSKTDVVYKDYKFFLVQTEVRF